MEFIKNNIAPILLFSISFILALARNLLKIKPFQYFSDIDFLSIFLLLTFSIASIAISASCFKASYEDDSGEKGPNIIIAFFYGFIAFIPFIFLTLIAWAHTPDGEDALSMIIIGICGGVITSILAAAKNTIYLSSK